MSAAVGTRAPSTPFNSQSDVLNAVSDLERLRAQRQAAAARKAQAEQQKKSSSAKVDELALLMKLVQAAPTTGTPAMKVTIPDPATKTASKKVFGQREGDCVLL